MALNYHCKLNCCCKAAAIRLQLQSPDALYRYLDCTFANYYKRQRNDIIQKAARLSNKFYMLIITSSRKIEEHQYYQQEIWLYYCI